MSSLDYLDLCRLCLVKDRASVPIFEGEGDERQIFLKIAACLPVKVAREDKLPKKICDDCVYKVESFYHFWNTTANAEKRLLQCLGEVGVESGKQGYVSNVFNPNVMKQEQSTENRLDGNVMQQVGEHQNNMGMGMMDNMGLGIPMIIPNSNQQQQITSVPMDTSGSSAQNVQAVPGPSSQTTHNQISQNQTSSTQQEDEEESSEDEENSDDECDGDEGLPVKEESEEDPNSRTIEPTTFVNVSLACDEAGPSGLQQQKIAEMPEMPIPQPADGDPKTGSRSADHPRKTRMTTRSLSKQRPSPTNQEPQEVPEEIVVKSEFPVSIIKEELIVNDFYETAENSQEFQPAFFPENSSAMLPLFASAMMQDWQQPFGHFMNEVPLPGSNQQHEPTNGKKQKRYPHQCMFCDKHFRKISSMQRHLLSHSNQPKDQLKCYTCKRVCRTKRLWELHEKIHAQNGKLYGCADCDFVSTKLSNLDNHRARMHTSHFTLKCLYCPKMFNLRADLLTHQRIHTTVLRRCDSCGKSFRSEYSYLLHRALHKSNMYPEKPKKTYQRKKNPTSTSTKKKRDGQFKCSLCKCRFKERIQLCRHVKRHLMSYTCELCGAIFKNAGPHRRHMSSRHNIIN